jgi:hypothetical protein
MVFKPRHFFRNTFKCLAVNVNRRPAGMHMRPKSTRGSECCSRGQNVAQKCPEDGNGIIHVWAIRWICVCNVRFVTGTTSSTELSSSWEGNIFWCNREILCLFWNPKIHCCFHKRPPLDPSLCQIDKSFHIVTYCFIKFHFNIILSFTYSALPTHPILFDLIKITIFGQESELWSSSFTWNENYA